MAACPFRSAVGTKDTRGLNNQVDLQLAPWKLIGFALSQEPDRRSIDLKSTIYTLTRIPVLALHLVGHQQVACHIKLEERIVDRNDF